MDSFCVAPWRVHCINASGTAGICCINHEITAPDHAALMAGQDMLDAMAAMRSGLPVRGCDKCYDQERRGLSSLRRLYNSMMPMEASDVTSVSWFDLSLGNKCNQACRICGPHNSTGWIQNLQHVSDLPWVHANKSRPSVPVIDGIDKIDAILYQMRSSVDGFTIEMKGGEPLYMESNLELLQRMVGEGLHHRTRELRIMTNGTMADEGIISLLGNFDRINLAISVDAIGDLHCYTRGVSIAWDECRRRWDRLASMPNVSEVRIANTIYAYNSFDMGRLAEWKDGEFGTGVSMANAILHRPDYLGLSVLTEAMRADASSGLPDDHPALALLARPDSASDAAHREKFRVFTHRLDSARGESIARLVPRLAPLLS